MRRAFLAVLPLLFMLDLAACAALDHDPVQVTVAGIDTLPGEGLEWRMNVKLRVQNPNDAAIAYNGVFLKMDVQDKTFATGVSGESGTIPRYGETIITVPMTVSLLRAAVNAFGVLGSGGTVGNAIKYRLEGKLDGPGFGATRFQSEGELTPPGPANPSRATL
jgi:hypothetical protein